MNILNEHLFEMDLFSLLLRVLSNRNHSLPCENIRLNMMQSTRSTRTNMLRLEVSTGTTLRWARPMPMVLRAHVRPKTKINKIDQLKLIIEAWEWILTGP